MIEEGSRAATCVPAGLPTEAVGSFAMVTAALIPEAESESESEIESETVVKIASDGHVIPDLWTGGFLGQPPRYTLSETKSDGPDHHCRVHVSRAPLSIRCSQTVHPVL